MVFIFGILTLYGHIGIVPLNCSYALSKKEISLHLFRSLFKICLTFLMFPLQYNLLKNTMKSWTFQMYRPKHQPHMKWLQMMLKFPQSEKVSLSLNLYSLMLENFLKQLWSNHSLSLSLSLSQFVFANSRNFFETVMEEPLPA